MRSDFRRASVAAVAGTAAFVAWSLAPVPRGDTRATISAAACLVVALALAGSAVHGAVRDARRAPFVLLALGGIAWAAGEAARVLHGGAHSPASLADAGYLSFVPFVTVAALLVSGTPHEPRARLRVSLDGLLAGGALLFLSWATVLGNAYRAYAPTQVAAVVAVAYPLADVILGAVAVSVLARLRGRAPTRPLCLGLGLLAFALGGAAGSDTGRVAGGLLLALAAVAPPYDADAGAHRVLGTLPYVPLAFAAATAFWSGVAHDGLGGTETSIGAGVVALVVARQLLGLSDNARLTRTLAAAEEHFRSLVQSSSDVLTVCEADGTIRFVSPAVTRVFGYDAADLIGTRLAALVHPEDAARVVEEVAAATPGEPVPIVCRYRHAEGRWVHVEALLSDHLANPSVNGLVFNTRDVSERKELERQLTHQAFHDPLTGLANRALFRDRVRHALALRSRHRQGMAVLFLDLDGFKSVNDTLGHAIGDRLLGSVAGRLQSVLRPGDTVARLGGDEFAVLLEDLDGVHIAQQVAQRFLDALANAFTIAGHEVVVGASIGLAVAEPDDDADELLRNADLAMYRAKALGKGRCEVFEPTMHAAALERMEIENDLRHAVVRGELRLHYQPIVELDTGRIVGVEALVRWQHPTRGLVSPLDFINVAEESGLIVPVGKWVLSEACRQVARWQRANGVPLRLSVNISARQLQAPRLAEHVAKTLRSTGVRPADLVLEITESMLVDDAERTIAKLHLLRELGVRLAVDDFGTGYSSLNYLRRLPVDVLKIDRSFVQGIGTESELTALTGAIVGIGRDLGLDTVAEGIEEHGQLAALRAMGCAYGQGYLYARPLPPDELSALLDGGRALDVAVPA